MRTTCRRWTRRALLAAMVVGSPAGLSGQAPSKLALDCLAAGGARARCEDAAVAARALMGHAGIAAGFGSEVPGTASALGRRLGSTPRVAPSLRIGGLHAGIPDVLSPALITTPAPETSFLVPVLHGNVAVGVLDGFSLLPTVGGFLSLDLVGQASLILLPTSRGFDGGTGALSLGARLGILRESFTLPGVSASVSRRWIGGFRLGDAGTGDPTQIDVNPSVTSIRAAVGKDLFAIGFVAGIGWDDYSASGTLHVSDGGTGMVVLDANLDGTRRLYFAGASMTFLVLQISAEGGWVDGFDPVAGYGAAPFDPTRGSAFGSLALRLTI